MKRGQFFAVDVPTFDRVCALGDADAAAAYLVLAAGTGPDNRTSSWAREAINRRTSLNWRRADAAIKVLEVAGLARWKSGKGTSKPRIDLPPIETRKVMAYPAWGVVNAVQRGEQPRRERWSDAQRAIAAGWLREGDGGKFEYVETRPTGLAWLPMSLLGDEKGQPSDGHTCMVERLRKSRDPMAFHLLMHLAQAQDLAEHAGVDRQHLRVSFTRKEITRTAKLQVWQFERENSWVTWTDDMAPHRLKDGPAPAERLFARVQILEDIGVLEWAFYLAEDGEPGSLLMFPVAIVRHGQVVRDEVETAVGDYATAAACSLSNRVDQYDNWLDEWAPRHFLLPVDRMNREAALVGVPRLRGKARTRNAQRWQADRMIAAREWIDTFRGILAEHAPDLLEVVDRRKADIKEEINVGSTLIQRDLNDSGLSVMHDGAPSALRDRGPDHAAGVHGHG